jgi:ABC-2 type transport system ATP-binding protein
VTDQTAPVLSLQDVTKHFGRHVAVNNVSFDVHEGDIFGFLGPNGAGKSTTLYMVSGLVHPTSGRIRIFGRPHTDYGVVRKQMGVLIETPAFYEYLSGYKNLEVLGRLQSVTDRRRIDEVLDRVGLLDRSRDRVGNYSHGMKQRLGIAQALLNQPRLLVLDEPTNGLDPEGSAQIWDLLRQVALKQRTSVLISSHLLHEVEEGCNRIAVINQGIIIACDQVRNLLFFSKDDFLFLFSTLEISSAAARVIGQREGTEVIAAPEGSSAPDDETAIYVRLQQGLAQDVIAELVGRGLTPTAVIPQKKTLKQFFLELTRRQPVGRTSRSESSGSD